MKYRIYIEVYRTRAAALYMKAAALHLNKLLFTCEGRGAHSRRFESRGAAYRKNHIDIKATALITVVLRAATLI